MNEIAAKKGNRLRINPEMELQARTMLKRDKCGGADGAVVEMVRALPWTMIMEVAALFDATLEKSEGMDQETRESWAEILLIWLRKVQHPQGLEDLRGISLINVLPKWFMLTV